jgi:fatty acid desaturase
MLTGGSLPMDREPPRLAEMLHLRASNALAALHVIISVAAISGGVMLSVKTHNWVFYSVGQVLLAFAFTHAFILLHEAGHHTLFRQAWLNDMVGHVAGFVALIPYASWRPIHARHHRYTGWQDLDATTATLVPRSIAPWERWVVNLAWCTWVPLFSILYRLQNYWHLTRVRRFLGAEATSARLGLNIAVLLTGYGVLANWIGTLECLRLIGPGLCLALMVQDIILLSQHTHMPTNRSGGANVRPFEPMQQGPFTRSMRLPSWLSLLLMHFDAHELHHMYPAVPGYLLRRIAYTPPNEVHWLTWIRAAKRLSGTAFLFGTREQTGLRL